MKKVLSIAMALMLGLSSFAQMNAEKRVNRYTSPVPGKISAAPVAKQAGAKDMPNWQTIGSTWTATDINGNTVNIADTMAAGKALLIDYSATWCSWCWVVHQAGLLEAVYENLGDDICVLWIESDPSTGSDGITGNDNITQGDWTNGGTVPYPIIDDASTTSLINNSIVGYPTIVFVSPDGYWCDVYSESWGFGPYDNGSYAVSQMTALLNNMPAAGEEPIIAINGPSATPINTATTFEAQIVSVDPVTSISWAVAGGTPSTSTDNPVSITWDEAGTYNVVLTVTNTSGTSTATLTVTAIEWNWGDTISYCGDGEMVSAVGANGDITWGIMVPAAFMAGRDYLESVQLYAYEAGDYDLTIYQGGTEAPQSLKYEYTYTINQTGWVTLPIFDQLALDDTKNLWVSFHNTGVSYPAAYVDFVGDYNGSLVCWQDEWVTIQSLSSTLNSTWMIKVVTSDEAPALNVAIAGPKTATTGDNFTFTAVGPSGATYTWTFQGADNTSGSGATATATWSNAGTYTVTLDATMGSENATATHSITVFDCGVELPFSMGFESNDATDCWTVIDNDNDGFVWDFSSGFSGHTGSGVAASASYMNNIGVLNTDNWLITPKITIPSDGATLSWWAAAQDQNYYQEDYSVLVSTNGTSVSSFTQKIYEGTPTNNGWKRFFASLSEFAGQDVYIAFRHKCSDMYYLLLDDIAIVAGNNGIDNAENVNVSLYPNPTNSMLNIAAEGLQSVEVMDMTGRMVMTTAQNTIDMSQLANGVYVVRVSTLNGTSIQKVVKK